MEDTMSAGAFGRVTSCGRDGWEHSGDLFGRTNPNILRGQAQVHQEKFVRLEISTVHQMSVTHRIWNVEWRC